MSQKNLLLGFGETLTYNIDRPSSGGPKSHPYSFSDVKGILTEQTSQFIGRSHDLPELAKPGGRSVARVTLHPAYLAKSYYPENLLRAFHLSDIGSKSVRVTPRKQTTKIKKENLETSCLYLAGTEGDFSCFLSALETEEMARGTMNDVIKIEELDDFQPEDKIRKLDTEINDRLLEVVLHTPDGHSSEILDCFYEFAKTCNSSVDIDRSVNVGGLTFLPVIADFAGAIELAKFTFLRVLRDLPTLRVNEPQILRNILSSKTQPALPDKDAINPDIRVAVFDGGVGTNTIDRWCDEVIYDTGHRTSPELLKHGADVTSTVLFGVCDENTVSLPVPYCNVDHYRVLDTVTGRDPDLFDVLRRITTALEEKQYDFFNLSLGPRVPIEDDEVHVWTSKLDKYLATGKSLATIAIGNDGEIEGQNRIQPPADLVNGLSVGAADTCHAGWKRASYSCIGPGRAPGIVKPDGVAFGGDSIKPFTLFSPYNNSLVHTAGTSFAAPLVLRNAIAIKSSLEHDMSALAVKALMIHNVEKSQHDKKEVGWGRFNSDLNNVVYCDDNEVTVVYRGELTTSQYVRIPLPFPSIELKGNVTIKATFCFASDIDPEHPINYTRSGLVVTFRPKHNADSTKSFFNLKSLYPTEQEFRTDGHKWETTLHKEQAFRNTSLDKPCFDVVYQAREMGHSPYSDGDALPYALVVTVQVKNTPEVYNAIRQEYQTLSPIPLRQEIRLQV
ncbi:Subtilisin-like serine protease [Methylophaga frappieri]|uniref:Subtilisin-like serine protease n=1 Tax=Methylophaga frappieri (strain ATCC BAA-2434 / DSM 25690 / JAM7) TaxID=754477 RepID=I1YF03_METFJ|nr:S8 family peptidase [Methylophaga frappieri]AFJ01496.1 Subtilisin-like serine protease [Methylophaga frappieri]